MAYSRQKVVDLICSWTGLKESNGSYKSIIDIYNSYKGFFPRGIRMQYDWPWCACTWSALAIKLGYTAIMPIEISCPLIIEEAKKMGCWQENDGYVASPGDAVLYDWDDNGIGDNTGVPDHIGTIVETHKDAGYFVVKEGNMNNAVGTRNLLINGRYIRGFITPHYDDNIVAKPDQLPKKALDVVANEVIAGTWGNDPQRTASLSAAGYDPSAVQDRVNDILNKVSTPGLTINSEVTALAYAQCMDRDLAGNYVVSASDGLYCRHDAGTNKPSMCLLPDGKEVTCYGYFSKDSEGAIWLYVSAYYDGIHYVGFCHSDYLIRTKRL